MLSKETRFWHQLSKQAVHDQNPAKLRIIVDEINRVLALKAARQRHLRSVRADS